MQNNYQENLEALEVFLQICKIPHASKHTEALKEWIIQYAQKSGADVKWDNAGNIHCVKGKPKLCLQGHYDMVYVSKNAHFSVIPEFITENHQSYLCAKDSSLGADNGVAVACMLLALRDCKNIECLFTNDEEIGMVGANHITLNLQAESMLNCDSEEIDEVVCGCAGGYDLEGEITLSLLEIPQNCVFYKLESKGFVGGHSGIMIHKNIPNAIIEGAKLAKDLVNSGALIVKFSGGEKRNSIPVGVDFCVAIPQEKLQDCEKILKNTTQFNAQITESYPYYFDAKLLLEAILSLKNGALVMREDMPILSSNIGILNQSVQKDTIIFNLIAMGRGNVESLMLEHLEQEKIKLGNLGFSVKVQDYYSPWEKEENILVQKVWEIYQTQRKNPCLKEIHAGLECGILKQKYPKINFVSIGPTILNPHSTQERLEMESFVQFDRILKEILKRFDAI
ncbi:M20/M25/M40 family metallo-hydrolase [Helicobacter sp. MIT 11-5569]|uniref:M20/M25/M40 family metallo-hydrolase n=1 Tax=Helicobacter sp. MIT 11-5569 TaxID=1548151 RepID=UPI00051F8FAE|nr:M20/M25/M40 family metallo-hydrolase [Helicobacter sp. MIT 11-5569]TLD81422.1 M20/M25/M40 family metallo-hydrolase [Helicobacter sp. MIT 11-5569]